MKKIIKKRFSSENVNWDREPFFNKLFLQATERQFNDMLHWRGYVFLRDIYEALGLNVTKDSCVLGKATEAEKEKYFMMFEAYPIDGTSDYELIFECYPILEYFEKEDGVV